MSEEGEGWKGIPASDLDLGGGGSASSRKRYLGREAIWCNKNKSLVN